MIGRGGVLVQDVVEAAARQDRCVDGLFGCSDGVRLNSE